MESETAVEALSALAQPTRLEVFRLLVQAGPEGTQPGYLAQALDIAPPTLSFHLSALRHAGLATSERVGRERVYRARFDAMHALVDYLTENCCGGENCRADGAAELAGTG